MRTHLAILMMLLVIPPASLAAEKYELDDPSGRQFLPDSVNNMIDSADRFKNRLDGMGDSVSNTYGNAKDRLNSLTGADTNNYDTSVQTYGSSGNASQAKRALGSMGSGSATTASAKNPAYDASLDVRAKQYNLEQQRNRCVTMRTGSETQAQCDLKAMCMEDDLKRTKVGYGMATESPNMAAGQCNGPNPVARAQAQSGDATLMGMLGTNGTSAGSTSPLDGLMQDQQRQEAVAAEAKRQEESRRQQVALAEQQRQAEMQRQAEVQRQQQVAAAQAEAQAEAESSGGGMDMFMGVLGAAASVHAGRAATRPTGNTYVVPAYRNTNSYAPSAPSGSGSSRSTRHCADYSGKIQCGAQ